MRRVLASWNEPGAWLERLPERLQELRRELVAHFGEEEAGGCVEEAVARCPALSGEARHLETEHRELVSELDEVIQLCELIVEPTARDARMLEQEVRAVIHKIKTHEAQENRIIEKGFSVCLDGDDLLREP